MASTFSAVIVVIFYEELSVGPRVFTNGLSFVLKGMYRIVNFNNWQ